MRIVFFDGPDATSEKQWRSKIGKKLNNASVNGGPL